MSKKYDQSGIILASATGITVLAINLIRAFLPRIILPEFDISLILPLSLITLVLEHYTAKNSRRDYRFIPLYGALIFGLFPLAGLILLPLDALKSALIGAVVFTLSAILFDSIKDRLCASPASGAAPLIGAVGLYLAAGCLFGII